MVIVDTCRRFIDNSYPLEELMPNTLLLYSTLLGEDAVGGSLYLQNLARQIGDADGATSLYEMHMAAGIQTHLNRRQTPEARSSCIRHIVLREFGQTYAENCGECLKAAVTMSERVVCDRCGRLYHMTCVGLKRKHKKLGKAPGFMWFCIKCRERAMRAIHKNADL